MPGRNCLPWLLLAFAASSAAATPGKDLARVAVLTFDDQTGTRNYGYLPRSLTEAIDKSLQSKFEYLRADLAQSEVARKVFSGTGAMTPEQAVAFGRKNGFDFVIYGRFTLDRNTREIVVSTYVATRSIDNFRRLGERKSAADATIFSLAEKVADDIVAEMTDVARSQASGDAGMQTSGKLEIRKEAITSWDERKFFLRASGGIDFLIVNGFSVGAGLRIGAMPTTSGYDFAFAQPSLRVAYSF